MNRNKVATATVAAFALSAVLAGCAGESSAGPGAADAADLAAARELVETYAAPIADVGVKDALSRKPDAGKHIVFLECNVPTCKVFGNGIEEAATTLGWKVTRLPMEFTPERTQSAFDQAIALAPDAIMSTGTTPAATQQQRAKAKAAGIPFFDNSTVYEDLESESAIPAVIITPPEFVAFQNGVLPAAWAVTQTEGDLKSIYVTIPDIPIVVPPRDAYNEALEEWCPETCSNIDLNVKVDDIGTNIPQMVVSLVQQNPDTDYVVYSSGDFSLGVDAALKAAGFNDVKTIGATPIQANIDGLRSGTDEAWAGSSNQVIGWRLVDAAARHFNGDPIPAVFATNADDTSTAAWPTPQIFTKDNAPATADFVAPEGYKAMFEELWQLK